MSKTTKALLIAACILLVVLIAMAAYLFLGKGAPAAPVETAPTTEAATEAPTEAVTEATTEATTEPTTEATTEPTTEPPTEPPVIYRNPLTGVRVDEPVTNRIFAVTISNVPDAIPHIGVNGCDMLYEMFIVTGAVRCLALYTNIENVDQIGSVRSTRYNFTDIGQAYDAFVAHAGGSSEVLSDVRKSGIDNKNIDTSSSTSYSFRDKERNKAGWGMVHCLFVNGPGLKEWAAAEGYRVSHEEEKTYGLNFVDEGALEAGETANTVNINMIYKSNQKQTTMVYDQELGEYVYNQFGKVMTDGKTGEVESFENVFILKVKEYYNNIYLVAELLGSGDGYYACDGKIIPIKWTREKDNDPFTFTMEDGTPLYQNAGRSYVNLAPLDSKISWE